MENKAKKRTYKDGFNNGYKVGVLINMLFSDIKKTPSQVWEITKTASIGRYAGQERVTKLEVPMFTLEGEGDGLLRSILIMDDEITVTFNETSNYENLGYLMTNMKGSFKYEGSTIVCSKAIEDAEEIINIAREFHQRHAGVVENNEAQVSTEQEDGEIDLGL